MIYLYITPMTVLPEFDTFDMILDKLLSQKRNPADAAMFPSALCEVDINNFSDELKSSTDEEIKESELSVNDLDSLDPLFFEAAIATLFKKDGFNITLTPKANDKGADIVALSNKCNYAPCF